MFRRQSLDSLPELCLQTFDISPVTLLLRPQILLPLLNLIFVVSQLLQYLKTGLVRSEAPLLQLNIAVCGRLYLALERIDSLELALVFALQLRDFLFKPVDVRLLIIAHLLKLRDVLGLLLSCLLQHLNRFSLLLSHLLIPLVLLVGPGQLLAEHLDITLHFLRDTALSVHLDVQRAQVVQLHQLLLQVPLVLQRLRQAGWCDWLSVSESVHVANIVN